MLTVAATTGFYETAAQILPIFLLVMVVGEARLGSRGPGRPSRLWSQIAVFLATVGWVLAGEVAALIAISGGETSVLRVLVCGGVAMGISYLMMQFLIRILDDYEPHFSPEAQDRQLRLVAIITVIIAGVAYAALVLGTA